MRGDGVGRGEVRPHLGRIGRKNKGGMKGCNAGERGGPVQGGGKRGGKRGGKKSRVKVLVGSVSVGVFFPFLTSHLKLKF